jgi:hypothetical protein
MTQFSHQAGRVVINTFDFGNRKAFSQTVKVASPNLFEHEFQLEQTGLNNIQAPAVEFLPPGGSWC